jgi:hypothetical protein
MTLPCENCIVFPICKQKVRESRCFLICDILLHEAIFTKKGIILKETMDELNRLYETSNMLNNKFDSQDKGCDIDCYIRCYRWI